MTITPAPLSDLIMQTTPDKSSVKYWQNGMERVKYTEIDETYNYSDGAPAAIFEVEGGKYTRNFVQFSPDGQIVSAQRMNSETEGTVVTKKNGGIISERCVRFDKDSHVETVHETTDPLSPVIERRILNPENNGPLETQRYKNDALSKQTFFYGASQSVSFVYDNYQAIEKVIVQKDVSEDLTVTDTYAYSQRALNVYDLQSHAIGDDSGQFGACYAIENSAQNARVSYHNKQSGDFIHLASYNPKGAINLEAFTCGTEQGRASHSLCIPYDSSLDTEYFVLSDAEQIVDEEPLPDLAEKLKNFRSKADLFGRDSRAPAFADLPHIGAPVITVTVAAARNLLQNKL